VYVDLNADLGDEITDDEGLLAVVTSANVACGYHAGTASIMQRVCGSAARRGVSIGAQVSYADRPNFGRVARDVSVRVLTEQVADQVGTLATIAAQQGTRVRYVKPHGALYHRVIDDPDQAGALLAGSESLPVLGLPGGLLLELAESTGRRIFREGFPYRGYTEDGRLLDRNLPGSVITDSAVIAANAVALAGSVDSVCVHGDAPGAAAHAVAHALAVRAALVAAGYELRGL
jgi:UPF0271 protein